MTSLASPPRRAALPDRRPAPPDPPARSLTVAGALAAAEAAVVGLVVVAVPVLVLWSADGRTGSTAPEALRACAALWLLLHGAGSTVLDAAGRPVGAVGLVPLGLSLLPVLLLVRAGGAVARGAVRRTALRSGTRDRATLVALVALSVGVAYALLGGLVAALASGAGLQPHRVEALLATGLLAAAAAGWGARRATSPGRTVRPRRGSVPLAGLTGRWRAAAVAVRPLAGPAVAGGGMAVAVVLAAASVLLAGSLVLSARAVADLGRLVDAGPVGGVGLVLLCVALLPNAVVWTLAWLAGPGFTIGAATSVAPGAVVLGPLPALPLLGVLPPAGSPGAGAWTGLAVVVAAGALAARLVLRRLPVAPVVGEGWRGAVGRLRQLAPGALLTAPVAGLLAAGACVLASGPAGPPSLAAVGPSAWAVGLAVTVEVALGALAVVVLAALRATRPAPRGRSQAVGPVSP